MKKYIKSTLFYLIKFFSLNNLYVFLSYWICLGKKTIFFIGAQQKIKLRKKSSDIGQLIIVYSGMEYGFFFSKMNIKDDINVIDIGGNIGLFTLYCDYFFGVNKSIVVEPDHDNFLLMKENLADNHIVAEIHENALYKTKGTISFDSSLRDDSKRIDINGKTTVKTLTILDLIDKNEKYDIMKIDIEGGEWDILVEEHKGCYKQCKYIILEYHLRNQKNNIQYIIHYFNDFDYEIRPINNLLGLILFTNKTINN